jgi:hypothetical protein
LYRPREGARRAFRPRRPADRGDDLVNDGFDASAWAYPGVRLIGSRSSLGKVHRDPGGTRAACADPWCLPSPHRAALSSRPTTSCGGPAWCRALRHLPAAPTPPVETPAVLEPQNANASARPYGAGATAGARAEEVGGETDRFLGEKQPRADEDERDGEYDRQRPSRQARGHPASDENAGDAAQ